ncbi:MAG: acetate--CoA ligase family protein [bacterium]|nr:acetate--CoA ligase family protein [bacterium]
MEKFFNPKSMVIFGLSEKDTNIPGYILDNCVRWGYKGRIFGVTPGASGEAVQGVTVYGSLSDLPIIPELAVLLIPAKFVPIAMEECGKLGIKRVAVLAGGFNESGEDGEGRAEEIKKIAAKYDIRFIGPNGLAISDTYSGVCLPFIPMQKIPQGGFSLISQSGGLGLVLWTMIIDENLGMAKFASIGNKLNIDECDMLEYFGRDPQTKVIGLYLESIKDGERLVKVAQKINKPIIALKANTSHAGSRAAMSHTASMSNNDEIVDAAFERAGIVRIDHVSDFVSIAKAFNLPPMRGNRLMVMTPGGGSAVIMADLCEKYGFEFADPGEAFYEKLNDYTNAGGIIKFSNPLDMGDIYNTKKYPVIFHDVLNSDNVDGAIYGHALPTLAPGDSIFRRLFYTDISNQTIGAMLSSGKPLGVCITAPVKSLRKMKQNLDYPLYERSEDLIKALRVQSDYYCKQDKKQLEGTPEEISLPGSFNTSGVQNRAALLNGNIGEEMLDLVSDCGIKTAQSTIATTADEAAAQAGKMGYPVVMKIVSPDVLHKSDAGGVMIGLNNEEEVRSAFDTITNNIRAYNNEARFEGIRVMEMAPGGTDMFIGAMRDEAFGPVVVFGYGGIYTEIFKDIERVLCPAPRAEIKAKLEKLKCFEILKGARGQKQADIDSLVDVIERISHLMALCPEIKELDLNPVRVFENGMGAMALDARAKIIPAEKGSFKKETVTKNEAVCC